VSAPEGKTDVPREPGHFRFGPRLCEKSREPRKRRIVFSIVRLPTEVANATGFRIDEIETDILHAT
jgi:hypothetical protein